jgi:hypothetical protein
VRLLLAVHISVLEFVRLRSGRFSLFAFRFALCAFRFALFALRLCVCSNASSQQFCGQIDIKSDTRLEGIPVTAVCLVRAAPSSSSHAFLASFWKTS